MSFESPRCRLCLLHHNDPDCELDEEMRRKLRTMLQVEVQLHPGLPDTVCHACRVDFAVCIDFRQRCLKANRTLRELSPELFPAALPEDPIPVVTGCASTPSFIECRQLRPIAVERCAAVVQSESLESLDLANDTIVREMLNQPGYSLPTADDGLQSEPTVTEEATHDSQPQGARAVGRSRSSNDATTVINIEARFVLRRGAEPTVEAVARQRQRLV